MSLANCDVRRAVQRAVVVTADGKRYDLGIVGGYRLSPRQRVEVLFTRFRIWKYKRRRGI